MAQATAKKTGKFKELGKQVDTLMLVLDEHGYHVELKQISPGEDEATVTVKISLPLQPGLFD